MNYQEALKRTESAYDWTSLSSSSIKSGSSSSSLPGNNVICLIMEWKDLTTFFIHSYLETAGEAIAGNGLY